MRRIILFILSLVSLCASAQVGEYRHVFSVGASGGYVLNRMTFQPSLPQKMHGGTTFGIAGRYTSEKYFSTLCAIQMEVNITQLGWNEDIVTYYNQPVINPLTDEAEKYRRDITYVQIPFFAHLSWGKEKNGVCGFVNLGPQIGFMLSEKTERNYDIPFTKANFPDDFTNDDGRVSNIVAQETMPVENKFDYGIALGAGIEASIKHIGRFNLEARYYYGLGNIYGDSKRDYFGQSSHGTIFIKLGYLYDLQKH